MADIETVGHLKTLAAKDAVVRTFGVATKDWPAANFWALVSSVKSNISDERIPKLMEIYKIKSLSDYPPEKEKDA